MSHQSIRTTFLRLDEWDQCSSHSYNSCIQPACEYESKVILKSWIGF